MAVCWCQWLSGWVWLEVLLFLCVPFCGSIPMALLDITHWSLFKPTLWQNFCLASKAFLWNLSGSHHSSYCVPTKPCGYWRLLSIELHLGLFDGTINWLESWVLEGAQDSAPVGSILQSLKQIWALRPFGPWGEGWPWRILRYHSSLSQLSH